MKILLTAAKAAAVVMVLLAFASAGAIATTARIRPAREVTFTSLGRITFTAGGSGVQCEITLRGSLVAGPIELEPSGTLGRITEASIAREACTGGEVVRVLGLPWAITYQEALPLERERPAMPGNVATLKVRIGSSFEIRGVASVNCLVGGSMIALWELTRTSQLYVNAYTAGLLTLTETRLPTRLNLGCGTCPGEVTATGSFALRERQEIRLGDPDSWIASLGDSYISGEGGRWAGNTATPEVVDNDVASNIYFDNETRTAETQPGCHRSSSAAIHIGHGVNSVNFACSGAKTFTFGAAETFKPGLDLGTLAGDGQVKMLQDFARDHWVRMIAISIGGNDFSFASTIERCVRYYVIYYSYCSEDTDVTDNFNEANAAARKTEIKEAIERVDATMVADGYEESDYTIVVQDYEYVIPEPETLLRYPESGYTRITQGGCPFWDQDARWATTSALPVINQTVYDATSETGLANVKFMDVLIAFQNHSLCEPEVGLLEDRGYSNWIEGGVVDETEWVVAIELVETEPHMKQESLHPNYWGQMALRNCVRQAYNGGAPRGGICVRAGSGLTEDGEPRMRLE